jgi:hypothetical protein
MNLDEKLQKKLYDQVWHEYCGFLDFSIDDFMEIQNRLMMEQIQLYANCELGQRIMKNQKPATIEEYRKIVPLTKYEDYADILLAKVESALPAKPLLWIETTWEGGKRPIKLAPYTDSMINCYKNNLLACLILSTSSHKGQFTLRGGENFLYGMAPLPYITGIVPHVIATELTVNFLPPTHVAESVSFGQRNKLGFSMGIQKGVDLFFGLSSVIAKMGDEFSKGSSGTGINWLKNSRQMNYRLVKAWLKSKREKTPIVPKDVWKLKGLVCAGTDTASLKKKIEQDWGIKPLEMFGGTEPACIATETWAKNGLVFFPDVCFYEFIPESELELNKKDPEYIPRTYLLNEVIPGNQYELVISNLKGGAFARYRVGDIFECISLENEEEGIRLPHFRYVDRESKVIDIAGFTRISERTIDEAIKLSKLNITDWFAVKEFNKKKQAFLHLYVEVDAEGKEAACNKEIITEQLSIYFRYVDSDYKDLRTLLGIEPMVITILPAGTINSFADTFNRKLIKMNPSAFDVIEVLKIAEGKGV